MTYYLDGIIVVEGHGDEAFLSSFIKSLYIITNGYDLPKEDIDFLKHYSGKKKVIVFTDPDDAGKSIRKKINDYNFKHIDVEVAIDSCNKNGKHGVAECDKNTIINVLEEHLSTKEPICGNITTSKLMMLGVITKLDRDQLCKKLHLGICNGKQLVRRINVLNIDENTIVEAMR